MIDGSLQVALFCDQPGCQVRHEITVTIERLSGLTLPFPPGWSNVFGRHYCPAHVVIVYGTEVVVKNIPPGQHWDGMPDILQRGL